MALTPRLYKSTLSLELSSTFLVLDAQGEPAAVSIFQVASALTVTSGRQGTVMADQSITFAMGSSLEGRALA